jgi:hypothetical protein
MPKILPILIFYGIIVSFLIWAGMAGAATLTWDYPDPPTDLAGFKVYVGDDPDPVKDIQDPLARSAPLFVPMEDGNNTITMTAYDTAGQESKKSEPCIYNPDPPAPVKITIDTETVIININ